MKTLTKIYPLVILALMACLTSCDEEPTEALEEIIKEDLGYLPVIASFNMVSPDASEVQAGTTVTFDLRFWSEGNIAEIQYWLVSDGDEALLEEQAYTPAYSTVSRTDSALFNFTVPASLQAGDEITVQARVINEGLEEYPTSASIILKVPE